jgi:rubrerythrin
MLTDEQLELLKCSHWSAPPSPHIKASRDAAEEICQLRQSLAEAETFRKASVTAHELDAKLFRDKLAEAEQKNDRLRALVVSQLPSEKEIEDVEQYIKHGKCSGDAPITLRARLLIAERQRDEAQRASRNWEASYNAAVRERDAAQAESRRLRPLTWKCPTCVHTYIGHDSFPSCPKDGSELVPQSPQEKTSPGQLLLDRLDAAEKERDAAQAKCAEIIRTAHRFLEILAEGTSKGRPVDAIPNSSMKYLKDFEDSIFLSNPGQPLLDRLAALEAVREAAGKIRHWHDTLYNQSTGETEGMVVSADAVRGLWKALAAAQKVLAAGALKEQRT